MQVLCCISSCKMALHHDIFYCLAISYDCFQEQFMLSYFPILSSFPYLSFLSFSILHASAGITNKKLPSGKKIAFICNEACKIWYITS